MQKVLRQLLLSICLSTIILAQISPEADWVDREIASKQMALRGQLQLAKSLAAANRGDYDVGYYGLCFEIDIPKQRLMGSVTIRGKSRIENLTQVDLDLLNNMTVSSVAGDAVGFSHSNHILSLQLEQPLARDSIFTLIVHYDGNPQRGCFQGFSFATHAGVPVVSTLSQPYCARNWFPCKDRPSDKADSVDITITVPSPLMAVSNGTLVNVIAQGDSATTYYWQERYPIASYLISLAISEYAHWEDQYTSLDSSCSMPVSYWTYPEAKQGARTVLSLTPEMIRFFASKYGEFPFITEKYGQAQFPWGGGMEHQTCTSLGSFNEMLTCHELAHQWWGDMVTCASWHNIWLNEGFARYSEALWKEHREGPTGLQNYMQMLNRPQYWQYSTVYIQDTTSVSSIFNRIVYDKGAWALHMLRGMLGDDTFWAILREYRARHAMQSVVTEDFQTVCEEVAGRDLDFFFNQWIYGYGQPCYQVGWQRSQSAGSQWEARITIKQIQTTPTYFTMPLEILIQTESGDTIVTVDHHKRSQVFTIALDNKPLDLVLDPDSWVLHNVEYSSIDPDIPSDPNEYALTAAYPNPFNAVTHFELNLPQNTEGRLSVFNLRGQELAVLKTGLLATGYYRLQWQPSIQASGVYIIRFDSELFQEEQRVLYLK